MSTYKVISAIKSGEYDSKYGKMFKYLLSLEGEEAGAELSQKPETPMPQPGDSLEGTIESTQYGNKFKKAQTAFKGASRGYDSEGQAWGNSMNIAVQLVVAYRATIKYQEAPDKVLELAKYFFEHRYKTDNKAATPSRESTNQGMQNAPTEDFSDPDAPPIDQLEPPF